MSDLVLSDMVRDHDKAPGFCRSCASVPLDLRYASGAVDLIRPGTIISHGIAGHCIEEWTCENCGSEDVEPCEAHEAELRAYDADQARYLLATIHTAIGWWHEGEVYRAAHHLGALVQAVVAWDEEVGELSEYHDAAIRARDVAEDAAQ